MSASIFDPSAYEGRNGFAPQPIRCHHLKALGLAPIFAKTALSGVEDDPTAEMSLGTTVHGIIQGRKDILVYRGAVRRGKEWEAFREKYPTAHIVLDKEMKTAEGMAAALLAHKDAAQLLKARGVKREETIIFDYLGRICRATPDLRAGPKAHSWVAELKTTKCAKPELFRRDAERLGYHVQLAMQSEAIRQATGAAPKDHYIIAIDNRPSPPWPIVVNRVDEDSIERGHRQFRLWMEQLLVCEASGYWPGYAEDVVPLKIGEAPLGLTYADDAADEATP